MARELTEAELMPPEEGLDLGGLDQVDPEQFWMTTYTGRRLYYLAPQPDQIDMRDLSRGLSTECRFLGQIETPYYVAEHVQHVASRVDPQHRALAVLHDSPEAYTRDIPRPFKRLLEACGFPMQEIERRILNAVLRKFGVPWSPEGWEQVIRADDSMLLFEGERMVPSYRDWGISSTLATPSWQIQLHYWSSEVARRKFESYLHRSLSYLESPQAKGKEG